jgi:hypothetical protein
MSGPPLRDTQETRPEPFTPLAIFSDYSGRGVVDRRVRQWCLADQTVATRDEVALVLTTESVTAWIEQLEVAMLSPQLHRGKATSAGW